MILFFRGPAALSDFRKYKYAEQLLDILGVTPGIQVDYIYLVETTTELEPEETARLNNLLESVIGNESSEIEGQYFLVTPRPGTISPWSSKATDIIHNCGLNKVVRVERGMVWLLTLPHENIKLDYDKLDRIVKLIHDRMTETVLRSPEETHALFSHAEPSMLKEIDIMNGDREALLVANHEMGLALTAQEIDYLFDNFNQLGRNPTDVELMMFAQANSEHCRHKIFNAEWTIDNQLMPLSLFDMIRKTHQVNPGQVKSAYVDNAAVTTGYQAQRFFPDPADHCYKKSNEDVHILMKVETHNHPTAISPYPGAATGSGGEIRDESATGRGAKPKAGLTGFNVSNLIIPGFRQPWEQEYGKPDRIVSALDIMIEGPIGGASFNNEFGRPALCGYFRSYEQSDHNGLVRGYHKPIMLAGGYGMIRNTHIHKLGIPPGAKLVVLGGPAMLIGLGGGAASSMDSGQSDAALDYASVQRDNPEVQRRCQEVIDACWALGDANPILSIHDVGAGGLSNALPELVSASQRGASFDLRKIPNAEPGMSPMEIWCNEAQERYVLAILDRDLPHFMHLCERERAPVAVLGEATRDNQLVLKDGLFNNKPIDMPMAVLLGKLPRMQRSANKSRQRYQTFDTTSIDLKDAIQRVLRLPTVADKRFLITIGDRSVSGLVVRDQMVGPWQTPVADCAVTAGGIEDYVGEAMAMGERSPVALIDSPAAGRMAIAEAITNIAAARILNLGDVVFSANWMAACGVGDEDIRLYETVTAVSEFCQSLGICIPVGKDSLSMNTIWQEGNDKKQVTAPLSLVISAFAPVADVRQSLTPCLDRNETDTVLLLIDLGSGRNRLGGSALAQVYNAIGDNTPDIESAADLKLIFRTIQILNEMGVLLAYHDRSDGGLFVTLAEMAFASRIGLDIHLDGLGEEILPILFAEEAGCVIQVRRNDVAGIKRIFAESEGLAGAVHEIATFADNKNINIHSGGKLLFSENIHQLHRLWSETSYRLQSLRDNPVCAEQEFNQLLDENDPGVFIDVGSSFSLRKTTITGTRPLVAILREQGVNGHIEMAAAFTRAGFTAVDVHMNDIFQGNVNLDTYHGIAACGGFSYGDVLGAGGGWGKSILFNESIRELFERFFSRTDTFGLGVCNGCQMLSRLQELIPGTAHWPEFKRNLSEQFESRLVMAEVMESPSILFTGMQGIRLPIVVAHGEGRAVFRKGTDRNKVNPCLRFINNYGEPAELYPANPNGSAEGLTGFTNTDGRFTIMMPHPERVFLGKQFSWLPENWHEEESPWMQIFHNARLWLE